MDDFNLTGGAGTEPEEGAKATEGAVQDYVSEALTDIVINSLLEDEGEEV